MTQAEALRILQTGANVFLTGEPGSGKTHTVNAYIEWLRAHDIEPAITASTGIAATHIGGFTIHSWSGIGIKREMTDEDLDKLAQTERLVIRAQRARVLIIDEISMLSAGTFSMVDSALRALTGRTSPFGGLQVILVGDFFQLPPISKNISSDERTLFSGEYANQHSLFAFSSPAWSALNPLVCYLEEQHRQEDTSFLEILTAVRSGSVTAVHKETLMTRKMTKEEGSRTELHSHNSDVDRVNERALTALPGSAKKFLMKSSGNKTLIEQLIRGCLSPEVLTLKEGARVMFTKNNFTSGFVNGTTGEVIGFSRDGYPIVKIKNGEQIVAEPLEWSVATDGKILAKIEQVPLRLAWAITVHKSQGMSLDFAHIDLSRAFEYGQGYVALSRVRTLSGLSLSGLNERALLVHPQIQEKDAEFREASDITQEAFASLSDKELEMMQEDFIRTVGGTVQKNVSNTLKQTKKNIQGTLQKTRKLIRSQKTLADIASVRSLTEDTIVGHVEELIEHNVISIEDVQVLVYGKEEEIARATRALTELHTDLLKPVFEHCNGEISYPLIRVARLIKQIEEK